MQEFKFIFQFVKKYKKLFIIGSVFVLLANLASVTIPKIVGDTVDNLFDKDNFSTSILLYNLLIIILLTIVNGVLMFYSRKYIVISSRRVENDLRNNLFEKISEMELKDLANETTGNLMSLSTNDIPSAREFLGPAIIYSVNTLATLSFALVILLNLNSQLTLIALLPLPIIAIITFVISKKINNQYKIVQDTFGKISENARATFSAIRLVRVYKLEQKVANSFLKLTNKYLDENIKLSRIEAMLIPTMGALIGISQVLVLYFGGKAVIEGTLTIGGLTQYFIYLNMLIWPIAAIGWITNIIQRAKASISRIMNVFVERKESELTKNQIQIRAIEKIRFKDVIFAYENDSSTLQNLNLTIGKGLNIGITGLTGSGKSTLVRLILGLYPPSNGMISVNNIDIIDIDKKSYLNQFGVVRQDTFLYSDTILGNLQISNPTLTLEDAIQYCKIACLHDDIEQFPDKYETLVGERGITLSGGQKQRLSIARALARNPNILLLDDAFSAVDTNTETQIINNLKNFKNIKTSIIVSQRLSSISHCDNIVYLENGKILESGTHRELLYIEGKYLQLWNIQSIEKQIQSVEN